ncbi:gluconate 2-dehydrogenase subunit 3 family protein [Paenibacillus radicis (ex Xue et al. 2023)]|uniref:Gluconate 2-dehydrogenase subunit 3 family protein n=1 Tax=Paenibacillus radicis (ex Xue et al. 2023) TaxID=2972489 RepID=A0ABT1YUG3_9BACL|nr:gluconate 2-dehydrogenase subunit 3 family protein [Paenibacillus radicis (ex Xue et al. 2023)]MCR8635805.1 gluconate 2-dehydrogenase subunit 3 family protein [Paenibacillus radicis (ex Xue et al. 2023)]
MAERRNEQPPSDSRRQFLKYSGTAIGGAVVGGVIGGAIAGGFRKNPAVPAPAPTPGTAAQTADFNQAPMYFNQLQLQITEAAAERIYPKDDIGPGAAELGVAFFIDHQMASPWGINAREYRIGPFIKGEVTQGDYQIIQRNELFTMGLQAMEEASKKKYTKSFVDLSDEEKDAILTSLEKGEIQVINDVTGKTFFNLLRRVTLEGVYSDPVYGGNKNMMGWKMRKYPGNQMVYTDIMEKNEFVHMEPRSLHDHFATH